MKTFVFRAEPPRLFRQLPGQYITLDLPIGGETVTRSYTISSSPLTPYELAVTVKRVPGGPGSNWLHDNLKPGMALGAMGPGGEFSCLATGAKPDAKYLFLSAGSGITPMMSMTRTLAGLKPGSDIAFIHSARTPADLIFHDELQALARRDAGLKLGFIVESRAGDAAWAGLTGRLSIEALRLLCPDYARREVYVCGPAPYMKAARAAARGRPARGAVPRGKLRFRDADGGGRRRCGGGLGGGRGRPGTSRGLGCVRAGQRRRGAGDGGLHREAEPLAARVRVPAGADRARRGARGGRGGAGVVLEGRVRDVQGEAAGGQRGDEGQRRHPAAGDRCGDAAAVLLGADQRHRG
nr:FAD-binding oxidoreductase [Derxia gummosa]